MFFSQGYARVLHSGHTVRADHLIHDRLLSEFDGALWNMYMVDQNEPDVTIHPQLWRSQDSIEEFGVSPAFQAQRKEFQRPVATAAAAPAPRFQLEGPYSPGHFWKIHERTVREAAQGVDASALGEVDHTMLYTIPGRELEYEAADIAQAEALAARAGCCWLGLYQNLGQPNVYARIVYWRDAASYDAGMAATAGLDTARTALIAEQSRRRCSATLYHRWRA